MIVEKHRADYNKMLTGEHFPNKLLQFSNTVVLNGSVLSELALFN